MKTTFLAIGVLFLLASCGPSSKEENIREEESLNEVMEESDVKITSNGLTCKESYMSNDEGKFRKNATFGENIQMNFAGVKGMEVVDGAVRADILFLFTTMQGDTVLFINYGDLKEQDFEVPDQDAIDFNVYTPVTAPVYHGETYKFKAGFKDVRTGKSLEGETEIKVNPNYDIEVTEGGLTYKEVYLYNAARGKYITDQTVGISDKNELRIRELDGFNLSGENALLGVSLLMTSDAGKEILNIPDLAADLKNGMPWKDIKDALIVDFTIGSENPTSYADIVVKIWDKNGDNTMEVKTRVDVKN